MHESIAFTSIIEPLAILTGSFFSGQRMEEFRDRQRGRLYGFIRDCGCTVQTTGTVHVKNGKNRETF